MDNETKYQLTTKITDVLSCYMTGTVVIHNCREEIIDVIEEVLKHQKDDLK